MDSALIFQLLKKFLADSNIMIKTETVDIAGVDLVGVDLFKRESETPETKETTLSVSDVSLFYLRQRFAVKAFTED